MKKTLEAQDQVRTLARGIHQQLLDLEAEHEKSEQVYAALLEKAAEMVNIGRLAPMYVRERANRLRALLDELQGDFGRSRNRHRSLYHQIERLDDALISAVLSPALEKSVGGGQREESATEQTGGDSILIYDLGGMRFGSPGRVLERRTVLDSHSTEPPVYQETPLSVFPHPGSVFMPRESGADLLIMNFVGRTFALWADKLIGTQSPEVLRNLEPLEAKNRFIKGRANLAGRPVYIIAPPAS